MAGETDFCILESRDRIGGRIQTKDAIDFGATWFNDGHSSLLHLIDHLKLEKYRQFNLGKSYFVYSPKAAPQVFEADQNDAPNYRVKGGTISITERLAQELEGKIRLNMLVETIEEHGEKIRVQTKEISYIADKLIVTVPPQLASCLTYQPALPEELIEAMQKTNTWMRNAMKVGIRFKTPFWRKNGQSGILVGQAGPVIELYDHTNYEEDSFALMGFVNESLRELGKEERKDTILTYLKKYFGKEIEEYLSFEIIDWSTDQFTACLNLKPLYMSSAYGNSLFQQFYMDGKLIFSGSETSNNHGAYLEGAVYSGLSVAQKIINSST